MNVYALVDNSTSHKLFVGGDGFQFCNVSNPNAIDCTDLSENIDYMSVWALAYGPEGKLYVGCDGGLWSCDSDGNNCDNLSDSIEGMPVRALLYNITSQTLLIGGDGFWSYNSTSNPPWTNLSDNINGMAVNALAYGSEGRLYIGGDTLLYCNSSDGDCTQPTDLTGSIPGLSPVNALSLGPNGEFYAGGEANENSLYSYNSSEDTWTNRSLFNPDTGEGIGVVRALNYDSTNKLEIGGEGDNWSLYSYDGTNWTDQTGDISQSPYNIMQVYALASDPSNNTFYAGGSDSWASLFSSQFPKQEQGGAAVPEFTLMTAIIACVAGFGIYLLIKQRNSRKKIATNK
jgi:hypothetical protein